MLTRLLRVPGKLRAARAVDFSAARDCAGPALDGDAEPGLTLPPDERPDPDGSLGLDSEREPAPESPSGFGLGRGRP
jgi:hypothetical protein